MFLVVVGNAFLTICKTLTCASLCKTWQKLDTWQIYQTYKRGFSTNLDFTSFPLKKVQGMLQKAHLLYDLLCSSDRVFNSVIDGKAILLM